MAIHEAMGDALARGYGDAGIVVVSDSMYSQKCLCEWVLKWEQNGWKGSKGSDVLNRDIIEPAVSRLRSIGGGVEFRWVKGHSGDPQNEKVDKLAGEYAAKVLASMK